jgi:hypothetical protein
MSDALGLSAVLVTSDARVPFGARSKRIIDAADSHHILASGHAHPPQSMREAVLEEARGEAGLEPAEIRELVCTGYLRALRNGKPELAFALRAERTLGELLAREREESWEFDSVAAIDWNGDAVLDWLDAMRVRCAAPGHAAVLLAARRDFGEPWFERAIARLALEPA